MTESNYDATPPLIAHVVYRFDYGGLENGIVNLINGTQGSSFRHCVIALTDSTDFRTRLKVPDVEIFDLNKKAGKDLACYFRLYRLLRRIRPTILHTRNIGTLDCVLVGKLAGVGYCIHGEHGWDVYDPDGTNRKYRWLRRLADPFVDRFITVSGDLRTWLVETVGIAAAKISHICNGVDTERFQPDKNSSYLQAVSERGFSADGVIIGSILRFQAIKDPLNLVRAFCIAHLAARKEGLVLYLVMIGDGELRRAAIDELETKGLADVAWLPGSRNDVAELMRSFDIFVLGSKREGISNTVLEAMSTGIPVIATETGGNTELIQPGHNGALVPPEDPEALAAEILTFARDRVLRKKAGDAARDLTVEKLSLDRMIDGYKDVYFNAIAG